MNVTIKNIKLKELNEYIESNEYINTSFVPISKIRALSHINNPRADKEDYCLFLAYKNDKLIGYLGAITDKLFSNGKFEKIFWLSCMWVLPEYRRDGIALNLLQHAYEIFSGKVLITNFIPQSKKAFEKTGQYIDLAELEGIRGYLRLDLSTLIIRKYKRLKFIKPILKLIDALINSILSFRLAYRSKDKKNNPFVFSEITEFSLELKQYVDRNIEASLFRRGAEEFQWIKSYPWVKKVDNYSDETKKYYFSQEGKDFKQWFIQVENQGRIAGFLILTKYRGEMKMPYLISNNDIANAVADFVIRKAIESKANVYVGYDEFVNKRLMDKRVFFYIRKSVYGFLIGKDLFKKYFEKNRIFYGDGDGVFT